jgi:iron complex outermembrane receptor protein
MVDAQAAYEFGRYTVEVSAVNLGGSRAYDTYEYFGFPVVIPVQPRSAYVTLKARF